MIIWPAGLSIGFSILGNFPHHSAPADIAA
jgi:hypothetical protein